MRILVTGATGFIGRHVATSLFAAGHEVVIGARNAMLAFRLFPNREIVVCDYAKDISADAWRPRLANIDAVVNCVGVLQPLRRATAEAIHVRATGALFDACAEAGVKRVIHISALGVDSGIDLTYATSKLAADDHLRSLDLDWTILRPSLVYTPFGSYGGTSLFRAQAALPFVVPLPGRGDQLFQPVFMDDLTEGIRRLLERRTGIREVIPVTGPEAMPLRHIPQQLRGWLGLGRAWLLQIPMPFMRLLARLGDFAGRGPLNTTALRMTDQGNAAEPARFMQATGIQPRRFTDVLLEHPAQVQDRWHARLYFLRPILPICIGLFWISTACVMLLGDASDRRPGLPGGDLASSEGSFTLWHAFFILVLLSGLMLSLRIRTRLVLSCHAWVLFPILLVWAASLFDLMVITGPLFVLPSIMPLLGLAIVFIATLIALALEDDR